MTTIIGVFDETYSEQAINALHRAGFNDDAIHILRGTQRDQSDQSNTSSDSGEPVTPADRSDGVVVPVAAGAFGSANLSLNPLAAVALGGAMTGGDDLGGDVFRPFNIPDDSLRFYQDSLKNGGTVIVVTTDDDHAAQARTIFTNSNASNVSEPTARH